MSADHDRIQEGLRRYMARTNGRYPWAIAVPATVLEQLLTCPVAVAKMRAVHLLCGSMRRIALSYLGMWLIPGSDEADVLLFDAPPAGEDGVLLMSKPLS